MTEKIGYWLALSFLRFLTILLFINPAFLGAILIFWLASGFQITPWLMFEGFWNGWED